MLQKYKMIYKILQTILNPKKKPKKTALIPINTLDKGINNIILIIKAK